MLKARAEYFGISNPTKGMKQSLYETPQRTLQYFEAFGEGGAWVGVMGI